MFNLLADAVHFLRIGAFVREGPLGYDFTAVQIGIYPVDGNAVNLYAISYGLFYGKAGSSEGWMLIILPS